MKGIIQSKATAWGAFVLILVMLVITFGMRTVWWSYIDIFFFFMMVFSHLVAVYVKKYNRQSYSTLEMAALIFGILGVLALIGEYIAWQVIIP